MSIGNLRGIRKPQSSPLVSRGFTLLEIMAVIVIMGLVMLLVMPYMGSVRRATLHSQARRLAGRATYLFDQAEAKRLVFRLIFDFKKNAYYVARLDPYAAQPAFQLDSSTGASAVDLPTGIRLLDVTVEGAGTVDQGKVFVQFYPEGYVDAAVVHLADNDGEAITLAFNPVTGSVSIMNGDVMPPGMFQ
ncbi:MAG: type II secretion system protein [Candidatus Binataceae bacterium]